MPVLQAQPGPAGGTPGPWRVEAAGTDWKSEHWSTGRGPGTVGVEDLYLFKGCGQERRVWGGGG